MAKAGKDLEIVTDLENANIFADFLIMKNGLVVCETYQEWAGPCIVMKPFLKKAKFEYLDGDDWDLVAYCSIKVEVVPAFKNLRGKCIPTYIFFGGKKPIGIFRGYEPYLLMPLIKEMVRREKLHIAGRAARVFLSDDVPYVFPEEDPVLEELVILETPFVLNNDIPLNLVTAASSVAIKDEEDALLSAQRPLGSASSPVPVGSPYPGAELPTDQTALPAANGAGGNASPVREAMTGAGTANLVQTNALPSVAPSKRDETRGKAAARAAVGLSPVETNTVVTNPLVTPGDQGTGNVTAAGGNLPGINEIAPGAGQGQTYIVSRASLLSAKATKKQDPVDLGNENMVTGEDQLDEDEEETPEEMPVIL